MDAQFDVKGVTDHHYGYRLEECRMEMLEGSSSDLGSTISAEF